MVTLSTFLNNIKTLVNQYVYTKEETRENFDNLIKKIVYENGVVSILVWHPQLNGETGAVQRYSYTESNGEGVGKGFLLNHGFFNCDNWELSFEFKHDNIRYTGIIFLCDKDTFVVPDMGHVSGANVLYTWEGSWSGGTAYASYNSGAVGWFDVKVTKIDSTHVRLQSSTLNRDTTVEVSWLPNAKYLTCGAIHNNANSSFGPCRIRNVKVILK